MYCATADRAGSDRTSPELLVGSLVNFDLSDRLFNPRNF